MDNNASTTNGGVLDSSREALVNTAVQFLQNRSTQNSPLNMKRDFLKKKGLTDEEIELAIKRSGITDNYQTAPPVRYNDQMQMAQPMAPQYYQQTAMMVPAKTGAIWFRDLVNSIIALGGVAYLLVWLYKNYIEPYLFGRKKKEEEKSPVELEMGKLKESVDKMSASIDLLEERITLTSQRNQIEENELITHIASLKGLLLNRKLFPATPQILPQSTPASIPQWQLPPTQTAPALKEEEDKKSDISPTNSTSSSSKSSNGTNSDSSLEVIKEKEIAKIDKLPWMSTPNLSKSAEAAKDNDSSKMDDVE